VVEVLAERDHRHRPGRALTSGIYTRPAVFKAVADETEVA
jgi:hypothetical protein